MRRKSRAAFFFKIKLDGFFRFVQRQGVLVAKSFQFEDSGRKVGGRRPLCSDQHNRSYGRRSKITSQTVSENRFRMEKRLVVAARFERATPCTPCNRIVALKANKRVVFNPGSGLDAFALGSQSQFFEGFTLPLTEKGVLLRWFKHFSDASRDEKIVKIEARYGLNGYARFFKLLELFSEQEGVEKLTYRPGFWASALRFRSVIDAGSFLDQLAIDAGLIVDRSGIDWVVSWPKFVKLIDRRYEIDRPRREEKRLEEKRTPISPKGGDVPEGFLEFWKEYPKKVAKPVALRAFRKLSPNPDALTAILNHVRAAKSSDQWSRDAGAFIPHPATYLNQRRWEDTTEALDWKAKFIAGGAM